MTEKHTPGPWTYEQRHGDRHILAANGESLQCDAHYYPWVSANEADWPLMAAAPEMLEALRELDECYCEVGDHLSKADRARHRQTLIKARAAIAKALGKASA